MSEDITKVQAIDVHAHFGPCRQDARIRSLTDQWCSADPSRVAKLASESNIQLTMVSALKSLFPRGQANALDGNQEAATAIPQTDGLVYWTVVNPLQPETCRQAAELCKDPKCAGIKIHPEEHVYAIKEEGQAIFEWPAIRIVTDFHFFQYSR